MAGNPLIPDEIEAFAKQLPEMTQRINGILGEAEAFLKDLHEELKAIRQLRRKLMLALKDDA